MKDRCGFATVLSLVALLGMGSLLPVSAQSRGQRIGYELDQQKAFLATYCDPPRNQAIANECQKRYRYAVQLQRELNSYIRQQNNRARQIERYGEYNNRMLRDSNCLASSSGC